MPSIHRAFRALRHRNFRLFLAGQVVSLAGTWMQQVALGWLVYRLSGSPLLLGLVGFCSQFPLLVVAPLAGVWADRVDRRRLVMATQAAGMAQALALSALVFSDAVTVPWVLALSTLLGMVSAVDVPARQAFMAEMLADREDLPNAIALNSSVFNAARMAGPALGGVLVAAFGEGPVFLVNALSYVFVLWALAALDVEARPRSGSGRHAFHELHEGLTYALGTPPIRALLLLVGGISLFGAPFTVFFPVLATDVLAGGPRLLGILAAAVGLGSTVGALHLAHRHPAERLDRVIKAGGVIFGLALLALAAARSPVLAVSACFAAGLGVTSAKAAANTAVQAILEDRLRGRVMSFYAVAFLGMTPLGSLAAGLVAERAGAPAAIALGGAITLVVTAALSGRLPSPPEQDGAAAPVPIDLGPPSGETAAEWSNH